MRYGCSATCLTLFTLCYGAATGCSHSKPEATAEATTRETLAQPTEMELARDAVRQFLEAYRTGDGEKAKAMFTELARQKLAEMPGVHVEPPASDTAKFEVGEPEFLAADGARVPCTWTDVDTSAFDDMKGKTRTDQMTWMIRKEPEGWRVAGLAFEIFEGENPVLLDFENPQETIQKLNLLKAEIERRKSKAGQLAQRDSAAEGERTTVAAAQREEGDLGHQHGESDPLHNNYASSETTPEKAEKSSDSMRR